MFTLQVITQLINTQTTLLGFLLSAFSGSFRSFSVVLLFFFVAHFILRLQLRWQPVAGLSFRPAKRNRQRQEQEHDLPEVSFMRAQKQQGEDKDSDGLGRAQRRASKGRECMSNDEPQARACCECARVAEMHQYRDSNKYSADEADCDDGYHNRDSWPELRIAPGSAIWTGPAFEIERVKRFTVSVAFFTNLRTQNGRLNWNEQFRISSYDTSSQLVGCCC
jgi:hypothetical protein